VGRPRLSGGPKAADWRSKLNPRFLIAAVASKTAILGLKNGDGQAAAKYFAAINSLRNEYKKCESGLPVAADRIYLAPRSFPPSANDAAQGIVEWLHWNRFRIPLWQDAVKAEYGDGAASKRVLRTAAEYEKRRLNPNWEPKFKRDLDHAAVFEMGLTLGLENLTEEELSDCFDALCPCGQDHSSDALRKQRDRITEDLRAAFLWEKDVGPTLYSEFASRPGSRWHQR
jgi:hypothetical protein